MGNEKYLKPNTARTPQERTELARKAGKASGKARRERKTIAEGVLLVLSGKAESGLTIQEEIVAKVIKRLMEQGDIKDLKTLTEVIGESKEASTTIPIINVITQSPQDKENIDKL